MLHASNFGLWFPCSVFRIKFEHDFAIVCFGFCWPWKTIWLWRFNAMTKSHILLKEIIWLGLLLYTLFPSLATWLGFPSPSFHLQFYWIFQVLFSPMVTLVGVAHQFIYSWGSYSLGPINLTKLPKRFFSIHFILEETFGLKGGNNNHYIIFFPLKTIWQKYSQNINHSSI